METLIICIYAIMSSVLIVLSYTLGLKNGQKLKDNIPIEMPKIIEPIKDIANDPKEKTFSFSKEQQLEWDNINNYDGTRESQKEFE